jgi:hypothetical protein
MHSDYVYNFAHLVSSVGRKFPVNTAELRDSATSWPLTVHSTEHSFDLLVVVDWDFNYPMVLVQWR